MWSLFSSRNCKSASRTGSVKSSRLAIEALEDRRLMSANLLSEYVIPDQGANAEFIARGTDGNLWFTDSAYNRVGRINSQGIFDTYIPLHTPYSDPKSITAGPDGNMWVLENGANQVARITPAGTVTEFRIPSNNGGSIDSILVGPDHNLWFGEFGSSHIGRVTPQGVVTEFAVPGYFRTNMPENLTVGPDGKIWFTLPWANQVGNLSMSGQFHMFTTGFSDQSFPFGITAGPDGNLWFTEPSKDQVARITPQGVVTELYVGITQHSSPTYITVGADGALWYNAPGTSWVNPRLGKVTTSGIVTEYELPYTSHASQGITTGYDGNLWFVEQQGKIGELNLAATLPAHLTDAANALVHSAEQYAGVVIQAYLKYLHRTPAVQEVNAWVSLLQQNLTDEQLEAGFIGSAEFYVRSGNTDKAWIDAMYVSLLNRPADPAGEAAWLQVLAAGGNRATIAFGFAASGEREMQRVQYDYATYLGRAATAGEVGAWVNLFEHGFRNEDLIAGFVSAPEYYWSQLKGRDDTPDWILSAYKDVLHRSPSTQEIDALMQYLQQ
jgi:virginiamycin B lyase